MNKKLASVFSAIGVWISVSALPVFAQGIIPVGTRKPPAPPEPGGEYSWVRKWCSSGLREYGLHHMMRCERLINGSEPIYVLPSYGCGTSCRIYNVQIKSPQRLANGWLRVHVLWSMWLGKFDADTKTWSWANEGFRSGPGMGREFWFAQCDSGFFGSARNSNLAGVKGRSVYIQSGKFKGQPRRTTVDAAIYDRWLKLCKFNE